MLALSNASGFIAPNEFETARERPAPDADAIRAELLANSQRFFDEDAAHSGLDERRGYEVADFAPASCACPQCGERNIDRLALDPDDIVTCLVCNTEYDISPAARLERVTLEDVGYTENWSDRYALAHPGALM